MRNKLIFLIAVIFGLTTAFLVYDFLNDAKKAIDNTEYINVVVATRDLPAKTVITSEMVTLKKIPLKYKHPQEITDKKEVIDKYLLVPVVSGQSLLKNQVLEKGDSKEGLAYLVPQGKRALTLAVDQVSGVAGLIEPGDRVDILGVVTIEEPKPKPYTLVVLQDIEVLAVNKRLDKKSDNKTKLEDIKTVTVAVSVEEAKPLVMASQRGVIRLILRSPVDNSRGDSTPFTLEDFLQ